MKIEGKVKAVLPVEKGTSSSGKEWQKQVIVVTVENGQYPYDIAIESFGEKVRFTEQANVGDDAIVEANVKSHEYNSKWYTKVEGWKFEFKGNVLVANTSTPVPAVTQEKPADDLPF